jgi:hypothetical protein
MDQPYEPKAQDVQAHMVLPMPVSKRVWIPPALHIYGPLHQLLAGMGQGNSANADIIGYS